MPARSEGAEPRRRHRGERRLHPDAARAPVRGNLAGDALGASHGRADRPLDGSPRRRERPRGLGHPEPELDPRSRGVAHLSAGDVTGLSIAYVIPEGGRKYRGDGSFDLLDVDLVEGVRRSGAGERPGRLA